LHSQNSSPKNDICQSIQSSPDSRTDFSDFDVSDQTELLEASDKFHPSPNQLFNKKLNENSPIILSKRSK
jgi:hypothetical protein